MIIEQILATVSGVVIALIELLPYAPIEIPANILDGLSSLLYGVGWFLPLNGLMPILLFSVIVTTARMTIAIAKYAIDVVSAFL